MDKVLGDSDESEEYKKRFKKLIENFINNSYRDDDIHDVLSLTSVSEEV